MAQQTYTIEVKVDTSDEGHDAMTSLIKQAARDLHAAAMLVTEIRDPQIICRAADRFYDQRDIDIFADEEGR